jgi:hypothetical protein
MRLYAARPDRRLGQVLADAGMLAWVVLWVLLARVVHRAVLVLAEPGRAVEELGSSVADSMGRAASAAGDVPVVGDELAGPFGSLGDAAGSVSGTGQAAQDAVGTLATVLAVVLVVLPVGWLLLRWLPWRLRWVRDAAAVSRLARGAGRTSTCSPPARWPPLPCPRLAALPPGTGAGWRAGDPAAVRALAGLEAGRLGAAAAPPPTAPGRAPPLRGPRVDIAGPLPMPLLIREVSVGTSEAAAGEVATVDRRGGRPGDRGRGGGAGGPVGSGGRAGRGGQRVVGAVPRRRYRCRCRRRRGRPAGRAGGRRRPRAGRVREPAVDTPVLALPVPRRLEVELPTPLVPPRPPAGGHAAAGRVRRLRQPASGPAAWCPARGRRRSAGRPTGGPRAGLPGHRREPAAGVRAAAGTAAGRRRPARRLRRGDRDPRGPDAGAPYVFWLEEALLDGTSGVTEYVQVGWSSPVVVG